MCWTPDGNMHSMLLENDEFSTSSMAGLEFTLGA